MALGKRSKSRSPNSGRGNVAQVNCVQTVRTEPQCKWRRATGVKKSKLQGKGGHEIRSDVSGETDVRNAEKSYCGALGGHPCKMNTYNGSEGVESMKLRVGEVKLIIGRVTQTTACLERELERMGEKVRHIEQSMSDIVSDAAIEDIVNEVVEAVSARERGKKIYMQKGMGIPRTTSVTRFRKGNIEAHKVKIHVKRLVDDMEVKRLKSKGRKVENRCIRARNEIFVHLQMKV
ncbi:uncharacterized protein LOC112192129 [Rosa chinensis]|uniref:uncharacterized protein LOC112192129 n=1 Tax=Rosa chinensis TaxID=74649 RepID=UPI001AD8CF13|nr:uncharacterized protein LOC112192129 [Rosa chinensis]